MSSRSETMSPRLETASKTINMMVLVLVVMLVILLILIIGSYFYEYSNKANKKTDIPVADETATPPKNKESKEKNLKYLEYAKIALAGLSLVLAGGTYFMSVKLNGSIQQSFGTARQSTVD